MEDKARETAEERDRKCKSQKLKRRELLSHLNNIKEGKN